VVAALQTALSAGHSVEIDVQGFGEENWERLDDFLTKATADGLDTGLIILCECFVTSTFCVEGYMTRWWISYLMLDTRRSTLNARRSTLNTRHSTLNA
jgi:hypothetical protein